MKIQITNGRLIDPKSGLDHQTDLFIAEGGIAAIGQAPAGFVAEKTIDASRKIVCPGLIDLAARLKGIDTELAAAVQGGVTTLVCPPDTNPPLDEPELVERLVRRAAECGLARVLPLGALTQNLGGEKLAELAGLKCAGCIAFSQAKQPITDTYALLRALEYAATFGFAVWLQPQDYWLSRNGVAHDGQVASKLGLTPIPVAAETIAIGSLLQLTRENGVRLHLRNLSSAAGVRMVEEARKSGLPVTCDVGVHYLHLTEDAIGFFDSHARLDPPLRDQADRAALRAAVANGVAALCSDHTPTDADDKALPFGEAKAGATGLELLLSLTLQWAQEENLPLVKALARVTCDPASICGSPAGHLSVGAPADVCIFDPDAEWPVTAETLKSRGKNTPFIGKTLKGKAVVTLVGGKVVFQS